jgi:Predicted phosphoesterase or phosphohydrolase
MRSLEQNAWFFTDPHFNHHKMVEWGHRPEGYEALIAANWLRRVAPDDIVYCLGDVAFKTPGEAHVRYVQSMPGYKILLLGNHDKQKPTWYLSHGWNEVHITLQLTCTIDGRHTRLLLSHVPQKDDGSFDLNVHGHFHNDLHRANEPEMQAILNHKHKLLSLETVNYDFVRLDDLIHDRV